MTDKQAAQKSREKFNKILLESHVLAKRLRKISGFYEDNVYDPDGVMNLISAMGHMQEFLDCMMLMASPDVAAKVNLEGF